MTSVSPSKAENEPRTNPKLQPINQFESMARLSQFEVIKKIGQGTFGVVQKARDRKSGNLVALKQLINHSAKEGFPITAMREITILKRLKHKNVLRISGMIHEEPKTSNPQDLITQRGVFYTVSPYMSSDLVGLLENPATELDVPTIKCILRQLLDGINYVHQQRYLHRDIKAANILLDPFGVVKIADFGLARVYHGGVPLRGKGPGGGERNYTALVVTRWYRPPELLLGERKYTTAVDMWGVGCVFAELFTKKPILVGSSDSNQSQIIFDLVGPPNRDNWTDASLLPNKPDLNIGLTCRRTLESRFQPILGDAGTDLLSNLLALDPKQRYNALDALDHAYFSTDPKPILPDQICKFEESHEIDKERFKKLRTSSMNRDGGLPKRPRVEPDRSISSGPSRDGAVENTPKRARTNGNTPRGPRTNENTPRGPRTNENTPRGPRTNENTPRGPRTNETTPRGPRTDELTPKRPRADQERLDRSVAQIRESNGGKKPPGGGSKKPEYF